MVPNVAAHRLSIRGDPGLDIAIDLRCRHFTQRADVSKAQWLQIGRLKGGKVQAAYKVVRVSMTA